MKEHRTANQGSANLTYDPRALTSMQISSSPLLHPVGVAGGVKGGKRAGEDRDPSGIPTESTCRSSNCPGSSLLGEIAIDPFYGKLRPD